VSGDDGRFDRWRTWREELDVPLVVAPMTGVSGPELAAAACASGVIGSFPTHNAESPDELDMWLRDIAARTADLSPAMGRSPAPLAVNIVLRRPADRVAADVECIVRHAVPIVIASVGSPKPIVEPLHDAGTMVFADVATMRHVRSAVEAGVDGLILLTAGAGGQTGWLNGLAFVRAVRAVYDGPVVMAGGVCDGMALWAAEVLGCDLGYMGTPFIATHESRADAGYLDALVASTMDDIRLVVQASGIAANLLPEVAGRPAAPHGYSAGHTVSAIAAIRPVSELVEKVRLEYTAARARTSDVLRAEAARPATDPAGV
jgi:nitronate monooxygenase